MITLTKLQLCAIAVAALDDPWSSQSPVFAEVKKLGMIEERYSGEQFVGWKLTERGEAWIEFIKQVPLPERRYIVPYLGSVLEVDRRKS